MNFKIDMEISTKSIQNNQTNKANPNLKTDKKHVFIIGCKGIPANYGGFETFVEKLTEHKQSEHLQYYVSCLSDNNMHYTYNGAECFNIKVPSVGSVKAIYYDIAALHVFIEYCKRRPYIQYPVFYVLACRIGPFIGYYKHKIRKLGGSLYVNPDGHEWKRAKWNFLVRRYWKWSERLMIKHADLIICDSKNIEQYIRKEYISYHPQTTFIAYGSETRPSTLTDTDVRYTEWLKKNHVIPGKYYLIVGRFVPENNFEIMIKEFLNSSSRRELVIITTNNSTLLEKLEKKYHFRRDKRIKFVGTVYDQELLKKIRENAYAYLHGHEVGGTNPSLLEALGSTKVNLLLNVGFNKEVAEDSALYWEKKEGNLSQLINQTDQMSQDQIAYLHSKAYNRISKIYNWTNIVKTYEKAFCNIKIKSSGI